MIDSPSRKQWPGFAFDAGARRGSWRDMSWAQMGMGERPFLFGFPLLPKSSKLPA
jgi:hypothetical protein